MQRAVGTWPHTHSRHSSMTRRPQKDVEPPDHRPSPSHQITTTPLAGQSAGAHDPAPRTQAATTIAIQWSGQRSWGAPCRRCSANSVGGARKDQTDSRPALGRLRVGDFGHILGVRSADWPAHLA
jgi:hypothetical protein